VPWEATVLKTDQTEVKAGTPPTEADGVRMGSFESARPVLRPRVD
jgi:hypothetical protein